MSKVTVTQAIYNYLQPTTSQIPNLGTVYTALPKVANEQDLFANSFSGQGFGGVIYMFMTAQYERRIALGGPHSGRKFRNYDLGLLCVFKCDTGTSTQDGQGLFDAFTDALTTYIEADRNAGDPAVIFQWGEGTELGGQDLSFDFAIPRSDDSGVSIFQSVGHITVAEILET